MAYGGNFHAILPLKQLGIGFDWCRSASETALTRKPRLRTASIMPSPARSSMASRTGVADT